jgi:hypothetical protein
VATATDDDDIERERHPQTWYRDGTEGHGLAGSAAPLPRRSAATLWKVGYDS